MLTQPTVRLFGTADGGQLVCVEELGGGFLRSIYRLGLRGHEIYEGGLPLCYNLEILTLVSMHGRRS
jgi:hypothetical protein